MKQHGILIRLIVCVLAMESCSSQKPKQPTTEWEPEVCRTIQTIDTISMSPVTPHPSEPMELAEPAPPPVNYDPEELSDFYEEGFDEGYEDGEDDAVGHNGWQGQYDDDCDYHGRARNDYEEGYEDGYETGYYDNLEE